MTDQDWGRSAWSPTPNEASIRYAIFGSVDFDEPMSRNRYRMRDVPEGFTLATLDDRDGIEWLRHWTTGAFATMADSDLLVEAAKATTGFFLNGSTEDPADLFYLRDVIGILTFMAEHGATAILDIWAVQWWRPGDWISEVFGPDRPSGLHVSRFGSPDAEGTTWFHTRGLRKFARPDLSVHQVGPPYVTAIAEMLDRFVGGEIQGLVIEDGREITMSTLPPGGRCWTRGSLEDLDYNNFHVEIEWPPGALS